MKQIKGAKIVALGVAIAMILSVFPEMNVMAETKDASENSTATSNEVVAEAYVNEMLTANYTKVSAGYKASIYKGEEVVFPAADIVADLGEAEITREVRDYTKADQAIDLNIKDVITLKIEVPETAKYSINLDYLSYDESVMPIGMSLMIDGDFPFYECRNLEFETTWVQLGERSFDRYNKEMVKIPDKLIQWESKQVGDGSYRYSTPFEFELEKGVHEVTLEVREGVFLLGAVSLSAPILIPEYSESQKAEGNALIEIQAEEFTYRNDSAIHSVAEYDTSLQPYEIKDTVLNTIDSDSFLTAGQKISYQITVEKAGYYYIGMNYRQSDKSDFPVFLNVEIDGEIPNNELFSYPMNYTNSYKTVSLTDDNDEKLSFYLEEGEHTISFTIAIDNIRQVLEGLDEIISGVNDLALEITKVAGTNADKYRDLKLSRYIPNLEEQLLGYAQSLYDLQETARPYSGTNKKTIAIMSSMSIAAEQLISLAEEPDEIPYRVAELCTSPASVNRHLANTVDKLIKNNLAIDRIYVYQEDAKLPQKPNIFKSAGLNISRFVSSFTDQAYSTSNTDPEHLQVWVNRSSQYVQIMQKMIDEYFTPETGIEVDISIMPDQYKLVLANTSGSAPDVATGINYTIPYELAIRGALVDMVEFEDFEEIAAPYEEGFFYTSYIDGGIYAMPETMNFWVLYYRDDILQKLGLEVPETMDDVIDMLPELQMRGLNYYQPVSGMLLMRNFHGTAPLIHQFGGALYGETAQEGTTLGSAIYNLPINVDNFYQHLRNGDLPIGVADYAAYNLMTNAAPELKNSWKIALTPGMEQEDGSINRTVCACAESSVIFKSDKAREEKAWEFVKWWSDASVQAEFGQTLQITYGSEYMWTTANMEAFMQLPWPTEDKLIIAEQMSHVIDITRVPGTYLLEREMSNAFNDIVVGSKNAQTRIDKAVKSINREFNRKLEEFEYIDSQGNTIKEYKIPNEDTIKEILGRKE